jgi:hypothetical protein
LLDDALSLFGKTKVKNLWRTAQIVRGVPLVRFHTLLSRAGVLGVPQNAKAPSRATSRNSMKLLRSVKLLWQIRARSFNAFFDKYMQPQQKRLLSERFFFGGYFTRTRLTKSCGEVRIHFLFPHHTDWSEMVVSTGSTSTQLDKIKW